VGAHTVASFTEFFCKKCLTPEKDEPLPDFNDRQWYTTTNMKGEK
jgi:hypothetical protein